MKLCKDCKFVDIYTEYNPFTDDFCRVWCMKKNRDVDRYKMIDRCTFWVAKVILILVLLLGSCTFIKYGDFEYSSLGGKSFDKLEASKDVDGTIKVTVTNYDKEGIPMMVLTPVGMQFGGGRQGVKP